MRILSLLILILFLTTTYSQDKDEFLTSVSDSLIHKSEYKASINELKQILFGIQVNDPYTSYLDKEVKRIFLKSYSPSPQSNSLFNSSENSFHEAKKNLLAAIESQPKFLSAEALGVLGDMFIYMNAAAAGYALYRHMKKYNNEY